MPSQSKASHPQVDQENGLMEGVIIAEEGPFNDDRGGAFDTGSLINIYRLMRNFPGGLKVSFNHSSPFSDLIGKFIGRAVKPRISGNSVKADILFSETSFNTPNGNLADYLFSLANDDPAALMLSLELRADREPQFDSNGRQAYGKDGEPLPDIWRPTKLFRVCFVDEGAATSSLFGASSEVRHGLKHDGGMEFYRRKMKMRGWEIECDTARG